MNENTEFIFDKDNTENPKVFTFRFDKMKKEEKEKFQDFISKYGEEISDEDYSSEESSEDN